MLKASLLIFFATGSVATESLVDAILELEYGNYDCWLFIAIEGVKSGDKKTIMGVEK